MGSQSAPSASRSSDRRSRRRLQWTLATMAVIPVAGAIGEIVRDPPPNHPRQGLPSVYNEVIVQQ